VRGTVFEKASRTGEGFNWPPPEESSTLEVTFEPAPSLLEDPADALESARAEAAEYVEAAEHVEAAESTMAVTALAGEANEPGFEETLSGQWEAEIARLQALLEALTETLEWRATGGIPNEPRSKH
jgi:hypothetical protein